jgi:hypothetical protein
MPHGLAELKPPEGTPPLRILVIIASPDDQVELDVERELAVMQDALTICARRSGAGGLPRRRDAARAARRDRAARPITCCTSPCHGAFINKDERGQVVLEDAEGNRILIGPRSCARLIGARDAADRFSACQSAKTSGLAAFDSVATGLLRADAPAVLAMQFSILDSRRLRWRASSMRRTGARSHARRSAEANPLGPTPPR